MIILAYDGSVYSDWVAKYALSFAAHEADGKLLALHVVDGTVAVSVVEAKFAQLDQDCQRLGVSFSSQLLSLGTSVHRTLRQAVPNDSEALLVCGTRYKPNSRTFLGGSLAAKLLRMHQCPVLAVRVVQPGLLANPHEILLPLAGHADGFNRVWPVFRRFLSDLEIVYLFRALSVNYLHNLHLTPSHSLALHKIGHAHLAQMVESIDQHVEKRFFRLDKRVIISTDWAGDILLHASRLKAQMILVGVSERSLAHRVIHGFGVEKILRGAPCDVGVYRGP
jgi:nucleotide-binding universal stress UspA family protein